MREELYSAIIQRNLYSSYFSEVTKENIADWAVKSLWYELNEKEIEILYEYLAEGEEKGRETHVQMIQDEFSEMTEDEKVEKFMTLFNSGTFEMEMFSLITDKSIILDQLPNMNDFGKLNNLINYFDADTIARYLESGGAGQEVLQDYICSVGSVPLMSEIFGKMQSEEQKSILLINSALGTAEKNGLIPLINNDYFKIQIVRAVYDNNEFYSNDHLIANIQNFQAHQDALDAMESDEQKIEYIKSLPDTEYDLKTYLAREIKSKDARNEIIEFKSYMEPDIEAQAEMVQTMITEFFEDKLGDKFDDNKRELMKLVFSRTEVMYDDLEDNVNGRANLTSDFIKINSRHRRNTSRTLSFLIHEYGHLFSQSDFRFTGINPPKAIEEGAQDLFAEMVINHYLEKHNEIVIGGKKVRMEYPHISYSGYKDENVWMRTILSSLEGEGKDIEAFSEYLLGDKVKYLEMVFGPEYASQVSFDAHGNPDINTSYMALYQLHQSKGIEVDKNSIYRRRNPLLPAFEIQRKVEEYGENILGGGKYRTDYIAKLILGDRKLFDISREEMEEFVSLYIAQAEFVMSDYDSFANGKNNELTSEDIDEHSFEILNVSIPLWQRLGTAGTNMERVWNQSFAKEIDRVDEGQDVSTSIEKYKKIIPGFLSILSTSKADTNVYIKDMVEDLQFAYLGQIEEAIMDGKSEEVLKAFTDKKTGEIYTDPKISELFKKHNIAFETISYNDTVYKAQDILDAAIRANVRFNDVASMSVIFDKGKEEKGQETEEVK